MGKDIDMPLAEAVEKLATADMSGRQRAKYTHDERVRVVAAQYMTGSSKRASDMTGVPASTIRDWKKNATWWDEVLFLVKRQKQAQLDGQITTIIDKLVDGLVDRLNHGDEKMGRNGELVIIPVSAADQARILKTVHDVRQLVRGEPTSRSENTNAKDLEQMLINAVKASKKENSIEGEATHVEEGIH